MLKLLFLAANPIDTERVRLDEEVREIDQALRMAQFRDAFDIRQHWAVKATDLQELLLRHEPDIVHFSGHGSPASEILLEGTLGRKRALPPDALSRLFGVLKGSIRCVVLNACYSEKQARAIGQHIDCVVGMSKAVGDQSAIRFAAAFYRAVGYGKDIKTAFELGCLGIEMEGLRERDTPQLVAARVNPAEIFLLSSEGPRGSMMGPGSLAPRHPPSIEAPSGFRRRVETPTPRGERIAHESAPFSFDGRMVFHPQNSAWGLSYDIRNGQMFLATPYRTGVGFSAGDLPPSEWIQLVDKVGRPAPVEVRVDEVSVQARWLIY